MSNRLSCGRRQWLIPVGHRGFGQCHAATIAAIPPDALVCGFFAGEREGAGDTAIWITRCEKGEWQPPLRLFAESGLAHWNPVLHFQAGRLWLFYKVGHDVQHWITFVAVSEDGGKSWSRPRPLVPDDPAPRGPVKNKLIVLDDGTWLAPGSVEDDAQWRAFVDRSSDRGATWQTASVGIVPKAESAPPGSKAWPGLGDGMLWEGTPSRVFAWDGVIQPSLWESSPGQVHMLLRSTRGRVYRSDSSDGGRTWANASPTELPNNNSGLDLARLDDGSVVLACNPVAGNWAERTPLSLLLSTDDGRSWTERIDVETGDGEFSYPSIIHTSGSRLDLVYTVDRQNIAHRIVELR